MTQVHLLFANKTYDTANQSVVKNQIIQMNGYDDDRYVIFGIGYYFDDENPKFMDHY
jgi:hypothetical protein